MTFECFLCERTTLNCLEDIDFYDLNAKTPESQRELRFVLEHLANCIRTKLIFGSDANICEYCYNELAEYDKLMVRLLASQKKLTNRLQIVISSRSESGGKKEEHEEEEEEEEKEEKYDVTENETKNVTENETLNATKNLIQDILMVEEVDVVKDITEELFVETITEDQGDSDSAETIVFEPKLARTLPECIICEQSFKSKLALTTHMSEAHNIKTSECKICGAVRKDEEYLELHMNVHEGKTEYECRYCPKQFARPVNTLRHMRKHWDKKGYQCEKCGERFSLDNMLYNHRLKHEAEENPLICSICNQNFKSRKTYNHHLVTHQKHRPRHQCPLCPKSFTERYTLKMHMTTHEPLKETNKAGETKETEETEETIVLEKLPVKYYCEICKLYFEKKELLRTHLKSTHGSY